MHNMRNTFLYITGWVYRKLIKPVFFLINPETVHHYSVMFGEFLGRSRILTKTFSLLFGHKDNNLSQKIFGIDFKSPIGLAAGFDYEARLTQILPSIGFGFGTVGTITKDSYDGNKGVMLGRLPKSKSLLVNKGFKNLGIKETLARLKNQKFVYPVGISIGKTNTANHKTQEEGVADVVFSFKQVIESRIDFSYYELNISCPNVYGDIEFYKPDHLNELLVGVGNLNLQKPVFIKMPISKTDLEIKEMLDVIIKFNFIKAVVIGNLQRDRSDKSLVKEEVEKFPVGNFSGLPCQTRSNELIQLVFKNYGDKIKIIGCGGTFSSEDAYLKLKLGASLVQIITGLIYEGPQLVAQINNELSQMVINENQKSISEVVGTGFYSKGV